MSSLTLAHSRLFGSRFIPFPALDIYVAVGEPPGRFLLFMGAVLRSGVSAATL